MKWYKLDKDKLPVPCEDGERFEVHQLLFRDEIAGAIILTAFQGFYSPNPFFETIVINIIDHENEHNMYDYGCYRYEERYHTYEEAMEGHAKAIRWVRSKKKRECRAADDAASVKPYMAVESDDARAKKEFIASFDTKDRPKLIPVTNMPMSWISVEEKLPLQDEIILFYSLGHKSMFLGYLSGKDFMAYHVSDHFCEYSYGDDVKIDKVSHWIPVFCPFEIEE